MENELAELAKKRVQARMGFVVHATMYLVANAGFVLIWFLAGRGHPWFVWPMLGWGIGIVAHGIGLVIGPGSAVESRAIDRELRRLRDVPH